MRVDLGEFRQAYLAEVEEHLSAANARLVDLERAGAGSPSWSRSLRELMRLLHTIKGLSAMVGIEPIVTIAHRMETVVRAIEGAGDRAPTESLDVLVSGLRAIEKAVRAVAEHGNVPAAPADLLEALEQVALPTASHAKDASLGLDPELEKKLTAPEREQVRAGIAAGYRLVRIDFAPSPAAAERGVNITSVRERAQKLGELVKVVPVAEPPSERAPTGLVFVLLLLTAAQEAALDDIAPGAVRETLHVTAAPAALAADYADIEASGRTVLRVDVDRVDDALEKLSALVVTRARLALVVNAMRDAGVDTRELRIIMQENGRQLRDLRASILRLRMVPVDNVLETLPLMIRGLARAAGKDVQLVVDGANAELDKTVGEKLLPALVHLLRNAVDHGIETPEERARAGKPPQGSLTVACHATGSRAVEIRVSDDGRGIDRVALAARARAKTGREILPDDAALLDLICEPGFSSREAADTGSGRGVGMDIVRRIVVNELGGELALHTTAGEGTTFVLTVPLTIAVIEAFTIRCEGERYAVPVPIVDEIVDLADATLTQGTAVGTRYFTRRGATVPLLDLAHAMGLPVATPEARRHALVVRRNRDELVGFAIDRVLQQQEAVVRPLDDRFLAVPGVSGATDLGDGRPTIVLDLLGLCSQWKEHAA